MRGRLTRWRSGVRVPTSLPSQRKPVLSETNTGRFVLLRTASYRCKIKWQWLSLPKNKNLRRRNSRRATRENASSFRRIWIRSKKLPKNPFPPAIRRPGFPSRQNPSENRSLKICPNPGLGNLPDLALVLRPESPSKNALHSNRRLCHDKACALLFESRRCLRFCAESPQRKYRLTIPLTAPASLSTKITCPLPPRKSRCRAALVR